MASLNMLPSTRLQVQDAHHTFSDLRPEYNPFYRNVLRFSHPKQPSLTLVMASSHTHDTPSFHCSDLNHLTNGFPNGHHRNYLQQMSTVDKSSNIVWHECSIGKPERQQLLQQKGCVIWITGLSGSGKSTVACALSRSLHSRGKLTYVLDGDNVRHGLNKDLTFGPEDRAENIRRVGEVAKLFADAGVICIASLISPYRRDRDACRALLPKGDFIEVFMDVPLELCEARDPKGLYKLARAGKIKDFTGIDDPYEEPQNCEVQSLCHSMVL
ncbi:hypothetical protein KSS87_018240 [Heliosperma pusillum]|nr:hypothetical protein KSS87_018240 [Heliosperma pusillum]